MKKSVNDKLNLFTSNDQTIKGGIKWHDVIMKRLAALIYTLENKHVNCEAIIESQDLIKRETGFFSMFKGNMMLCIASMLSLQENREQLFSNTMTAYNKLKAVKFSASDYLTVAAFLIASNTESKEYQRTAERAKAFYDGMKKQRRFHTGKDDYIFTVMLGLSEIAPNIGVDQIDQLYIKLKPEFRAYGSSLQTLCQLLVLSGKAEEASERLLTLRNTVISRKVKLDKMYTLPVLGILSLLPANADTLVGDILDVQSCLRTKRGLGFFTVTTQELLLYSSAIVSSAYAEDMKSSNISTISAEDMKSNIISAISAGIAGTIIAQQLIVLAAVIASSAAVIASASD